jgi:hypothetical protein
MKPNTVASNLALRFARCYLVVTLVTGLLASAGIQKRAASAATDPLPEVQAAEAGPLLPAQSPVILQGGLHNPQFGEPPEPTALSSERPRRPTDAEFAVLSASDAITVAVSVVDATMTIHDSTQSGETLSNLYPARPSNWTNGPIVISGQTGTTANSELRVGSDAYVDWAIYNAGGSISAPFRTCLWMDDAWLKCWTSNGLLSGYVGYVVDWNLTSVVSPQIGWHRVGIWTDADEVIGESNDDDNWWSANFYWYPSGDSINLTPYTPNGWADPVVLASAQGADADPRLYVDGSTYADVAYANYGSTATAPFDTCLYVDDVEVKCWSSSLAANTYRYWTDIPFNVTQSSWHTVTLWVDRNNTVAEANENDNVWQARFLWEGRKLSNLRPYQPEGWGSAIVVSPITGTSQTGRLVAGDPSYVDWAVVNNGFADATASFRVGLYIDGVLQHAWTADGVRSGWYIYVRDFPITLGAGSHRIEIRADVDNTVAETSDADNAYTQDFYWDATTSTPRIRVEPQQVNLRLGLQAAKQMEPTLLSRNRNPQRADQRDDAIPLFGAGAKLSPIMDAIYPAVPLLPASGDRLLSAIDLSAKLPPVGNQGDTNSCVGWASSYYYKTYQEGVDHGRSVKDAIHQFSPNYVWNQIKVQDRATGAQCGGSYPSDALKLIREQGNATLSAFPFTTDCQQQPTTAQRDQARTYKAEAYASFFSYQSSPTNDAITRMKQWLSSGDLILLSLNITPKFDRPSGPNCLIDVPDDGQLRGGHAVTIVGYDDNIGGAGVGGFKIVNSWGTGWGCNGFGYLSYRWVLKHAHEAWWMRDVRTGGRGPRDFTIFNDGQGTLTIDSIQRLQNSDWLSLVLPSALPMSISPGGRATIGLTVNGHALSAGTYTEQVALRSNDPRQRDTVVTVTLQVGDFASGSPPAAAGGPQPSDGADRQPPTHLTLRWASPTPDTVFSVWMGETEYPTDVVCNGVAANECSVASLKPNTIYFWRVITHDGLQSTPGPIWHFTTGATGETPKRFTFLPILRRN